MKAATRWADARRLTIVRGAVDDAGQACSKTRSMGQRQRSRPGGLWIVRWLEDGDGDGSGEGLAAASLAVAPTLAWRQGLKWPDGERAWSSAGSC